MLLRALKFLIGVVAGIFLWWDATPFYNRLIGAVAQPLLHIDSRFAGAVFEPLERMLRVTSSTPLPVANIPADLLTYNVILLLALFATNDRPWYWKNLRAVALSLAVLFLAHVAGLLISVESTYALRMAEWSTAHYSVFAQDVWLVLELFYRIVGMFGVAFACWWTAGGFSGAARSR